MTIEAQTNQDTTMYRMEPGQFHQFTDVLLDRFDRVIGPRVRDAAIVYEPIRSARDLPIGVTDEQKPGYYRLKHGDSGAFFAYNTGASRWTDYLQKPDTLLWSVTRDGAFQTAEPERRSTAFLGVRACELEAIRVMDGVLAEGEHPDAHYVASREETFIVAAECTVSSDTCFCVSMNTGPECGPGADIVLREIVGEEHYFIIRGESDEGRSILESLSLNPAGDSDLTRARNAMEANVASMKDGMPGGAKDIGAPRFHGHGAWDQVAERCLTCSNCTMTCPTCFCVDIVDRVNGESGCAERVMVRDSCFSQHYSYAGGKPVRTSVRGRYHQWMTHKLSTWHDQFGMSGCTGCGHCITWCPAGIDIKEEARALLGDSPSGKDS